MKTIILTLTKGALILTVAYLASSCNNDQPKSSTTATASSSQISSAEKIVFVNSDTLLANYEYFKQIKGKFESKAKSAQSDLQSKGAAFQKEVAAYQQSANSLSAEERASTEQRLARKQQELQAYNQNAGNALQSEEAAENEKLYDRVAAYLKKHAKTKGYKMVLTYSKANPSVLFADESLDVTKEVLEGLNKEFKADKK